MKCDWKSVYTINLLLSYNNPANMLSAHHQGISIYMCIYLSSIHAHQFLWYYTCSDWCAVCVPVCLVLCSCWARSSSLMRLGSAHSCSGVWLEVLTMVRSAPLDTRNMAIDAGPFFWALVITWCKRRKSRVGHIHPYMQGSVQSSSTGHKKRKRANLNVNLWHATLQT